MAHFVLFARARALTVLIEGEARRDEVGTVSASTEAYDNDTTTALVQSENAVLLRADQTITGYQRSLLLSAAVYYRNLAAAVND